MHRIKMTPFMWNKTLCLFALNTIFKSRSENIHVNLYHVADFGHNDKTYSFQFYFNEKERDGKILSFLCSANSEKAEDGKLFLSLSCSAENPYKDEKEYMEKRDFKLGKSLFSTYTLEKIEKAVVGGVQNYSKTITYNFSFSKKDLSVEVLKNIAGTI